MRILTLQERVCIKTRTSIFPKKITVLVASVDEFIEELRRGRYDIEAEVSGSGLITVRKYRDQEHIMTEVWRA